MSESETRNYSPWGDEVQTPIARLIPKPYLGRVVLHVPHDSDHIPDSVVSQYVLDIDKLRRELIRMTDHRTHDLFGAGWGQNQCVRAEVSRLVVDVERFVDDAQEPMAARGMGAVYMQTANRAPLRRALSESERNELLECYYFSHHARLKLLVDDALQRYGQCLVMDCHSFPSQPLPYELDQDTVRPDICIGTDGFHTPPQLAATFIDTFAATGFDVRVNSPFAGALVPIKHYQTDTRVSAIMVEVNRRLYMDEASGTMLATFESISERITGLCQQAISVGEKHCLMP